MAIRAWLLCLANVRTYVQSLDSPSGVRYSRFPYANLRLPYCMHANYHTNRSPPTATVLLPQPHFAEADLRPRNSSRWRWTRSQWRQQLHAADPDAAELDKQSKYKKNHVSLGILDKSQRPRIIMHDESTSSDSLGDNPSLVDPARHLVQPWHFCQSKVRTLFEYVTHG